MQSSDQRQALEVGWKMDRGLNGDDTPHLFVFHWVDGARTCYNGRGFVPRNEPGYTAGATLPVSVSAPKILHTEQLWTQRQHAFDSGTISVAVSS